MQLLQQAIPVLDHGFVRYVDSMGTDARILEAARVSYRSEGKGKEADKKLLAYLFRNKHTSPFEMCKVTFNIKMPIFVMRQFIRHRLQDTKNKQSSIHNGEWDKPVEECGGATQHELFSLFLKNSYEASYMVYETMLAEGVAREMARMVLPVNIYTEIYSTWDLNNLLKFFFLRDDPHAQWEHQQFALAMKQIIAQLFPWTMEIYENTRTTQSNTPA